MTSCRSDGVVGLYVLRAIFIPPSYRPVVTSIL